MLLPMAAIVMSVAERHGLTLAEIKTPTRAFRISWPRQEAMYELRKTGRYSLPKIALFFGISDHSTVHYGIDAYERRAMIAVPPKPVVTPTPKPIVKIKAKYCD